MFQKSLKARLTLSVGEGHAFEKLFVPAPRHGAPHDQRMRAFCAFSRLSTVQADLLKLHPAHVFVALSQDKRSPAAVKAAQFPSNLELRFRSTQNCS